MSRADIYEKKAEKIINKAVDYCIEFTDKNQKLLDKMPSPHPIREACKEYLEFSMNVWMEGQKPFLKLPDVSITLHDGRSRTEKDDFHPDIRILKLDELCFKYREGENRYAEYIIDCTTLDSTTPVVFRADPSSVDPVPHSRFDKAFLSGLFATARTIAYFLEEGFRRGCVALHQRGAWNFSRELSKELRNFLYNDSTAENFIRLKIIEVMSRIDPNLKVEYILDMQGGNNETFPCLSITYASCNGAESSYFPQKTSDGWQLSTITEENNLTDMLYSELNLFVKRANNIISYLKGQKTA